MVWAVAAAGTPSRTPCDPHNFRDCPQIVRNRKMNQQLILNGLRLTLTKISGIEDPDERFMIISVAVKKLLDAQEVDFGFLVPVVLGTCPRGRLPWRYSKALAVAAEHLLDTYPGDDIHAAIGDQVFMLAAEYLEWGGGRLRE